MIERRRGNPVCKFSETNYLARRLCKQLFMTAKWLCLPFGLHFSYFQFLHGKNFPFPLSFSFAQQGGYFFQFSRKPILFFQNAPMLSDLRHCLGEERKQLDPALVITYMILFVCTVNICPVQVGLSWCFINTAF